jgi:hypothetical protein
MPTAVAIISTNAVGMNPRRPRPPYLDNMRGGYACPRYIH